MINYDYSATRYNPGTAKARAWDTIKLIIHYLLLYIGTIYAVHLYSYLGKIMLLLLFIATLSSLYSYIRLPAGGRDKIVAGIRRNLLVYQITAIGGFYLLMFLQGLDSNTLGVSFGFSSGTALNNTVLGFIPTMLQLSLIVTPITHIFFEIRRIHTYKPNRGYGNVSTRKRIEQFMKTRVER